MIRVHAEHLHIHLCNGLQKCYLLTGNDLLLLQESLDAIITCAKKLGFIRHFNVILDNNTDWDLVFRNFLSIDLFSNRQILIIKLPENRPNTIIFSKIEKLNTLLHNDNLLIIVSSKFTKIYNSRTWYKLFGSNTVCVSCFTPENIYLPTWVISRSKRKKLKLDKISCQLLCHYYEGNLLALNQALDRLSLLFPDGNLTTTRVEQSINDEACFMPFQWIDAILESDSKRSLHILRQLLAEGVESVVLLRVLQRELFLLLNFQRQRNKMDLHILFDRYRFRENRHSLIRKAIKNLSLLQIHQSIKLLARLEITLKQNCNQMVLQELEILSLLLCNKNFLWNLNFR